MVDEAVREARCMGVMLIFSSREAVVACEKALTSRSIQKSEVASSAL